MSASKKKIYVIKANGKRVPFDHRKVEGTCIRAGASRQLASFVANKVYDQVHHGTTTKEIYRMVLKALATEEQGQIIGHRYRLKESIMLMGPAGFEFESYIGRILEDYGYQVKSIRSKLDGKCVTHEVDVVAYSDLNNKMYMIECKYHNLPGIFTGLKESLYTHARFLDLSNHFEGEILVCNTKVSKEAITYSTCIGQEVISWRYPPGKGLEKMIEDKGLYPLTILSLHENELLAFSENNIMVAKDLLRKETSQLSSKTGISIDRLKRLQNLVGQIVG